MIALENDKAQTRKIICLNADIDTDAIIYK